MIHRWSLDKYYHQLLSRAMYLSLCSLEHIYLYIFIKILKCTHSRKQKIKTQKEIRRQKQVHVINCNPTTIQLQALGNQPTIEVGLIYRAIHENAHPHIFLVIRVHLFRFQFFEFLSILKENIFKYINLNTF